MAKAIEQGLPKRRIEEAAARTQARIDSGRQTVIGVNAFPPTVERALNVLKVDAAAVRAMQIEKLKRLRAERDEAATQAALEALTERRARQAPICCNSRSRRRAPRRRSAKSRSRWRRRSAAMSRRSAVISGVYLAEAGPAADANQRVIAMTRAFAENEGHRPRILVAKMGQDGHDRGQKIIASAFADLGFDVKIGPLFATPEEVAALAAKKQGPYRRRLLARRRPSRAGPGAEERARQGRDGRGDDRGRRRHPRAGFRAASRRRGRRDLSRRARSIAEAAQSLIERLNERLGYTQRAPA